MATELFSVREYRPKTQNRKQCWVVDIHKSFAGRRLRIFAQSEPDAWIKGREAVDKIRLKGITGLKEKERGMTLAAAYDLYEKKYTKKSDSHKDKVEQIGDMLKEKFDFLEVTPRELEIWFRSLEGTETTRAMFYRYIRMFFRWVEKVGYLPSDPSKILDAPKASVGRNILSPDEMERVLELELDVPMRAAILLAGFAGLRTSEILRMNFEDIDTEHGQIHVRPGVMKDSGGFDQRIVDFTDPLLRRKDELQGKGRLFEITPEGFHKRRRKVAEDAGLGAKWPDNCLRHSFATYHLGKSGNPSLTAYQMGHTSPSMVQRVYAVPAKRAKWQEWWAL